jgi:acyl carrier protein
MASNEEILAGLAEIVNEETGLAPEAVELDKSFTDDLDIDSISMMTIVVNAEEKFGVRIPDEEVKNLKTVGDAVYFIATAQAYVFPSTGTGGRMERARAADSCIFCPIPLERMSKWHAK